MGINATRRVTLRPVEDHDRAFLLAVYASTRRDELQRTGWDDATQAAFLEMQFRAQDTHYRRAYPGAEFQVILADDRPVGRLYVHCGDSAHEILDIAILPEYQRLGIGTGLLRALLDDAAARRVGVTIYVEKTNPARQWYDRLGFRESGDTGVYHLMKWSPAAQGNAISC